MTKSKTVDSASDRELRRGTLELLVLHSLGERPSYGYELIQRLQAAAGDRLAFKEGTVYPVLYRLEDAGWIVPEWDQPARGVPRKVYRLTEAGAGRLAELVAGWRGFVDAVETVLSTTENDGGKKGAT